MIDELGGRKGGSGSSSGVWRSRREHERAGGSRMEQKGRLRGTAQELSGERL